jgi:hypothetical protein
MMITWTDPFWARVVSNLFSPPVVWAVLVFPIALRYAPSQQQAIIGALTYGVLVCLLPILYVAWKVKQGVISDVHMPIRQQRLRPFLVSLGCTAAAWCLLRTVSASPVLPLVTLVTLGQLAAMLLITLVWQISMHAMSITCAVLTTGLFFGVLPAVLVAPLIPLVGAARLKLQRHTLAQVVGGAFVGLSLVIVMLAGFASTPVGW